MSSLVTLDLTINQWASFSKVFSWQDSDSNPIDLTGYSARMHVRETKDAVSTIVELTSADSKITLGGALGTITLALTPAQTQALTPVKGAYYDLLLEDGSGVVTRFAEGRVEISEGVTKA